MKKLVLFLSLMVAMLLPTLASASGPPVQKHSILVDVCIDNPSQSVDQTYFIQSVDVATEPDVGICATVTQYAEDTRIRMQSFDVSFYHPPDIVKREVPITNKLPLKTRMRDTLIASFFY
jgi:hypothetical protein